MVWPSHTHKIAHKNKNKRKAFLKWSRNEKIQTWKIKQIVTHALSLCLSIEMEFLGTNLTDRPTRNGKTSGETYNNRMNDWMQGWAASDSTNNIPKWRKFVFFFFFFNFQCNVHKKKKNLRWQTSGFGVHVYFCWLWHVSCRA